jgi:hypothetical protein
MAFMVQWLQAFAVVCQQQVLRRSETMRAFSVLALEKGFGTDNFKVPPGFSIFSDG